MNSSNQSEKSQKTQAANGQDLAQSQSSIRRFGKSYTVVYVPDKNKDKDGKSVLIVRDDSTDFLYAVKAVASSLKSSVKELGKEVGIMKGLTESQWTIRCAGYVQPYVGMAPLIQGTG